MKYNLQKLNTQQQGTGKYYIFAVGNNSSTVRSDLYGWEDRFNEIPTCVPWELDKNFLYLDLPAGDVFDFIKREKTQQLITIIRSEIERKRGMTKDLERTDVDSVEELKLARLYDYRLGYNTAINEDIAYWENVLKEIEKNV